MKPDFDVYDGLDPYCFVSYSHADTAAVYGILERLSESGFRLWYDDTMEIGDDFRKELKDRIIGCDAFVLFVSKASMSSKYCGMEIITAHAHGKRIFPIQIEPEVEIAPPLRMVLDNLQHVKAHTGEPRYVDKLISSLPPETMRRLTITDGTVVKCADNGSKIEVPEGVHCIGDGAFRDCLQLVDVVLPTTLTRIEDEAFRGCSRLRSIEIGPAVEHVGQSAFRDCVSLESIRVSSPSTLFGPRAFENCASLNQIDLPQESPEIFEAAFNSCRSLDSINFPTELKIVGDSAFADCARLLTVDLPVGTVKVDARGFADCVSLESVHLPHTLSRIGKYAFKGCRSLTSVSLPAGMEWISSDAFRECTALEAIEVDARNRRYKSVNGVLFNKSRSQLLAYPSAAPSRSYEVPDSVTRIEDWAFCQADNLEHLYIADSVTEIGEGAFYSMSVLKEIAIPDSVIRIEDTALRDCAQLEKVTLPESLRSLGWGIFLECPDVVVHCKRGSLAWSYCEQYGIAHEEG